MDKRKGKKLEMFLSTLRWHVGSKVIAPLFSLLRHWTEMSCHHHAPASLLPGKNPSYSRTALFWVITQLVVVISYRRLGTT